MPGILKLGATTLTAEERARQLTAATACPVPFTVVYQRAVHDVNAAEAEMHRVFADRRVAENREFFQCSALEACVALDRIAGEPSEIRFLPQTPWADLFAEFNRDPVAPPRLNERERAQCRQLEARLAAEQEQQRDEWREAA